MSSVTKTHSVPGKKNLVKNLPANAGDIGSIPDWGRSPKKGLPTPVFLPGKSHGQRSLLGYSPRGHKESEMTETLNTHTDTQTHTWPITTVVGCEVGHPIHG